MYLKSVIIDGFKSYGRRTEIHGFDGEFTAITGLNGTGKSNILDAICFVLGIMNLVYVRANSYQDLVYKSGQAGVSKATVTLIFDNTDSSQCPLGYEKCREISVTRQIVIGGKSKYLINGKLVQNKKASDFFCSVQLNVNNPNFLIMQGRITKVLNMKSHEILSMVEEAAGTSLYESKREATTKLIEKKDAKVRETISLLEEEVEPRIEKLRRERSVFLEYQKICRDIEYITRIHVSHLYLKKRDALKYAENVLETEKAKSHNLQTILDRSESERSTIEQEIIRTKKNINTECQNIDISVKEELTELLQLEATELGNLKATQNIICEEEEKLHLLENSLKDDKYILNIKKCKMTKMTNKFQSLKDASISNEQKLVNAQLTFDLLSKGLSTDENGKPSSLQEQLINAKQRISEAKTRIKTTSMELNHYRNRLEGNQKVFQNNDKDYKKDQQLCQSLQCEIDNLTIELDKCTYNIHDIQNLKQKKNDLIKIIRNFKQQLELSENYKFEMRYSIADSSFDRSKVHCMVGKLFFVREPKYSLALVIAAGSSLYSYVTDDDETSTQILQNGQLKQRVTIIPINKVSSNPIQEYKVEYAKKLVGEDNVTSALSLIEYDIYFDRVMKFAFGHCLICYNLEIAKQVTYNRNIHCRTVTLDGDVIDPEGTLSGGSVPRGVNVLEEIAEIRNIEKSITIKNEELNEVEKELSSLEKVMGCYQKRRDILETRRYELNSIKLRLAQTPFEQHKEEVKNYETEIRKLERVLESSEEIIKHEETKVKYLEEKLHDIKGCREKELKSAAEAMSLAKEKVEESRLKWRKHEQDFETKELEIQELQKIIDCAITERDNLVTYIKTIQVELKNIVIKHSAIKEKILDLKNNIQVEEEKKKSQNENLQILLKKNSDLQASEQEVKLEIKKSFINIGKICNEREEIIQQINHLEQKYEWITEDRQFFGMKNTRYEYSKEIPLDMLNTLNSLTEKKKIMERHINMRALVLLDREEEQYTETLRRKKIVEQDKEKIQLIISKMDEKKREKIEKAYQLINNNFSSIFSTLLPDAQAELHPLKQDDQITGLEIRVGFSGKWKESLGELSGGQRSLVALSLILAMLKFSPAPLYILDEVDAALDMSHTQNIGNMLKTHFTSSQFIIVSLKDGMFNNANVLFRTKFEEGVSTVVRNASVTGSQLKIYHR